MASGPHGGNAHPVSQPLPDAYDIDAEVSPDGSTVAFERDLPDGMTQIILADVAGTSENILDLGCLHPCAADLSPGWTPNGRALVFTRVMGPFPGETRPRLSCGLLTCRPMSSPGSLKRASTAPTRTTTHPWRSTWLAPRSGSTPRTAPTTDANARPEKAHLEAMRCLKRRISDAVYRQLVLDAQRAPEPTVLEADARAREGNAGRLLVQRGRPAPAHRHFG